MCCFSRPIESVTSTRIFGRWLPTAADQPPRQCIVYQMNFKAAEDLSMILPIPVPSKSDEKAVKFVELSKEKEFFGKLAECFMPRTFGMPPTRAKPAAAKAPLEVVKVGSFDASFVPSVADFSRLDARFRLPAEVWEQLPAYHNWGFAVFKLRQDATTVHPMAFSLPRLQPERGLFLPTVHIHDGKVHKKAKFDHTLYVQSGAQRPGPKGWEESSALPSSIFQGNVQGLLDPKAHVYRRVMQGNLANTDTWA